jgi:dTDP-4-dehydrorhamnose 3,5-epimerase
MRQANLSRSDARVLRGLHLHRHQADLWVIAEGHAFVALVDVRPLLAGTGGPRVEALDASPGDTLYLPAGVAHGFYARDPITLVYLVTNEYDGTDELGFAWDDPQAAVPWPDREPILSGRDASAPSLAELIERLRAAAG